MSSARCRFGGDGIVGLLWQLAGAVAIGELANAGDADANGWCVFYCFWWKLWSTCWCWCTCHLLLECLCLRRCCWFSWWMERPLVVAIVLVMLVVMPLLFLFCWWRQTLVCHTCLAWACVWSFLLWQLCCQCTGVFLLLLCLFQAKWLWRNIVPSLGVAWLLVVGIVLFHQTHRAVLCGLCSICGSSWCCHLRVLHLGWVDTLCVVPAMVQLGVCWWLFCRSFVVIGLLVFWFAPSVLDGNAQRCPVLVSCMLAIVGWWCCRPSCLLLFEEVLSGDPLDLTVAWSCWVLLVLCQIPWGMTGCSWHGIGSLVVCLLPLLP